MVWFYALGFPLPRVISETLPAHKFFLAQGGGED